MGDTTAEKRLELIRNIREANQKNRMTLRGREHILYGNGYDAAPAQEGEERTAPSAHSSTLILRTIIAAILLSLFIIMDYLKAEWLPIDMEELSDCLQKNYTVNIIDFMNNITDTLSSGNDAEAE